MFNNNFHAKAYIMVVMFILVWVLIELDKWMS